MNTIDTSTYNSIRKALEKDKLAEVIELMRAIPSQEDDLIKISGRWQDLRRRTTAGELNKSEEIILHNQIRNSLFEEFATLVVEEANTQASETAPSKRHTQYMLQLDGIGDRKLAFDRNFIGREAALAQFFEQRAAAGGHRMLVTGTGGMGKTDFCKAILRQIIEEQPTQPIFWLDAESMTSLQDLVLAFGYFFEIPDAQIAETSVLTAIRQQPGLYYLDNLESLFGTDAKANQSVRAFLQELTAINHTAWLASSRRDIASWKVFRLQQLSRAAATQLFLEEWNQSSGQNLLQAEPAWEDFVEQDLGAHPLSIVLTASNGWEYGTVAAVMEAWHELDSNIAQRYASEQADRKQDSLDTSIILSVHKLVEQPKAMLLWSLFLFYPEGMSREAQNDWIAQGAFSRADIRTLLQRNLLQNQEGTLWMLPPLIRFARIHVPQHNFEFSERALFEECLAFGLAVLPEDYMTRSKRLFDCLPFIFLFMDFFVIKLHTYPSLLKIADKMYNFYDYQIWSGRNILIKFIQQAILRNHIKQLANYKSHLGGLEFILGNNEQAKTHFSKAVHLYEKTGSKLGKANCERDLGRVEFHIGNNEQARMYFNTAAYLYEQRDSELGKANCESDLGQLEFRIGNNEQARTHFSTAMQLYEKIYNELGKANCELDLGQLEFRIGNNEQARIHFSTAMQLYEKTDSELGKANCESDLGQLEFQLDNNGQARIHFTNAIVLYERIGDKKGKSNCERDLGQLELKMGNDKQARVHLTQSIILAEKCGYALGIASANFEFAKLEKAEQNEAAAQERLQAALSIAKRIQAAKLLADIAALQKTWEEE